MPPLRATTQEVPPAPEQSADNIHPRGPAERLTDEAIARAASHDGNPNMIDLSVTPMSGLRTGWLDAALLEKLNRTEPNDRIISPEYNDLANAAAVKDVGTWMGFVRGEVLGAGTLPSTTEKGDFTLAA